jgi:cytochrome d ubiquinol oxidase subunit II
MDLNIFWFILLGVLLTGYAILDGFDFGVGALHLFVRKDEERRILMNSIGPVWDGNEVWLVTFGGALFAAFPMAYAAAFSGFYLAFFLLLFALIFRAVALEFRSKEKWSWWRNTWDVVFFVASVLSPLLMGVAIGNLITGVPLQNGNFVGGFFELLKPYPILVGLMTLSLFVMHGAIYLYLKTGDELQKRVRKWMWTAWGVFVTFYIITTSITLITIPSATHNFEHFPLIWGIVVINVLAIVNILRSIYKNLQGQAFISSAVTIACLVALFGMAIYPNMITSSISPAYNLTIYNAASSQKTLAIMRFMAFIGMPFVLSYTIAIYWIFRDKVRLSQHSY